MKFVVRVGNLEAMDQEVLQVRGLVADRYSLQIDGKPVLDLTKQQLSAGVNLALTDSDAGSGPRIGLAGRQEDEDGRGAICSGGRNAVDPGRGRCRESAASRGDCDHD